LSIRQCCLNSVKQVRHGDRVWTFPFETGADIIAVLRTQLAYEVTRGLTLSQQMRGGALELDGLTGEAFRLALEKPFGWEGKLFAKLILTDIARASDLRRDYDAGVAFGPSDVVTEAEATHWLTSFSAEAERLIDAVTKVVKATLNEAFRTGSVQTIAYGARQFGRAYRESLEWAARLRRAHLPEDWRPLAKELSVMLADITTEIERFASDLERQVNDIVSAPDAVSTHLSVTFNLHVPEMERFHAAIREFKRKRGLE